ncbi:MAG: hypothetical protein WC227_01610 [Patescibacteria group bacterium]
MLQKYLASQELSDWIIFGLVTTIVREFMPKHPLPSATLAECVSGTDFVTYHTEYDDVLNKLTSLICWFRLSLTPGSKYALDRLPGGSGLAASVEILHKLIRLHCWDQRLSIIEQSLTPFQADRGSWPLVIQPIVARLEEITTVAKATDEKFKPVQVCMGHPAMHLRCYGGGVPVQGSICSGICSDKSRDLEECLRRYNEATANGKIKDHGYPEKE